MLLHVARVSGGSRGSETKAAHCMPSDSTAASVQRVENEENKSVVEPEIIDTTVAPSNGGGSDEGGEGGAGGNGSSGGGHGGNSGDEGGEGKGKYWSEVSPFIASLSRGLEHFPGDFRRDIAEGLVPLQFVKKYVELQAKWLTRLLMKLPGFRNKLLADPSLLFKLGIEIGIGIITKCSAEYQKRKPHFKEEIDFAFANLLMALVADWMLVFLPAPTMVFNATHARRTGLPTLVFPFLRHVPKNAFQRVPLGMMPFSPIQRLGAIGVNGAKLFGIGTFASFLGVATTNGLIFIRGKLNPEDSGVRADDSHSQNVLKTSLLYGSYMGINSNIRYQCVAGIEDRILSRVFQSPGNLTIASAALRISNTYVGSLMWIDTLRLVGMQPKEEKEEKQS